MTNWEWLEALANNAPGELQAWFDSEHVETPNATLHGDTAALERKIAELTADRDELQAKVDELKELNEYHALQYELASEDADRLQAQVDRLTDERELYRSKFGKCLDYADAIHALMDDEGMA